MHDYRRILTVVDFNDASATVARRALKLARLGGLNWIFCT